MIALGESEKAEAVLLEALRVAETAHGPEDPDALGFRKELSDLHKTWGKSDKAKSPGE